MLDRAQQLGVFLAHDLVELRGPHPGLLHLLEGFAGFDALMLPGVADQQNAVLRPDPLEKLPHLLGAGEAGLIDHVQMPVCRVSATCVLACRGQK